MTRDPIEVPVSEADTALAATTARLLGAGALALVGLGRVREAYGSLTGEQLGRGLVTLALADRHGRARADVRAIRRAGAAA